jgi:curli biogenesis system outer membrane secretion channel CsgG/Tfp pilus assembly protein PilF
MSGRSVPARANRAFVSTFLAGFLLAYLVVAAAADWGMQLRDHPAGAGAEVVAVSPASAAARAGVMPGDVVVRAAGVDVRRVPDFAAATERLGAAASLTLRVSRAGWERDLVLAAPSPAGSGPGVGLRFDDSPVRAGSALALRVAAVAGDGLAAGAGIRVGDLVTLVAGIEPRDAEDFARLARAALQRGGFVRLTLQRDGWEREVELRSAQRTAARESSADRAVVPQLPTTGPSTSPPSTSVAAPSTPVVAPTSLPAPPTSVQGGPTVGAPTAAGRDPVDVANRAFDEGRWADAEAAYRRIVAADSADVAALSRLVHVLVVQHRYADAIALAPLAAIAPPPELANNLALSFLQSGQPANAVEWYQKTIAVAPDWALPRFGLGAAYFAQAQWSDAEKQYRWLTERQPSSGPAWKGLASACAAQQRHAEAADAYRRAVMLGEADLVVQRAYAWSLYRSSRFADAGRVLQQIVHAAPADVSSWHLLATVEERQGKTVEAREAYERVAALDADGTMGRSAREVLAATGTAAAESPAVVATAPAASSGPVAPSGVTSAIASGTTMAPSAAPSTAPSAAPSTVPSTAPSTAPSAGPSSAPASARPVVPSTGSATVPSTTSPVGPQLAGTPTTASRILPSQRAIVAVGDFQVKAASAGGAIGDGLREMMVTSLHNHGRFIVVERMDIPGLTAEQTLSRSPMARPGSAVPEGKMDVADLFVYGAVTEFVANRQGGRFEIGLPGLPLNLGMGSNTAHLALDLRVVDVTSGRLLSAQRFVGDAQAAQATIGGQVGPRSAPIPASLGMYANTPMEQAIRQCLDRAIAYITTSVPAQYFHHD